MGDTSPQGADTERAVARTVVVRGPLSRSDVARRLGLSPASMTRLAKPLIEGGLLVEGASVADPLHGRLVRPLDVSPELRFIGVKIALGAVHGVLTDARTNVIDSIDLDLSSTSPDAVVAAAAAVVRHLTDGASVERVGVSLGGHTDDHASVVLSRSLGWRDVPLGEMLTAELAMPVVIENDVTALTEARHLFSPDRDTERFALVTVGVGVGCGLVINGEVVRQLEAASPSPSMLVLNPGGPSTPQGPRGSALAYLASTNVALAASAAAGTLLTFDEALGLARAADPAVQSVVHEAASYLGRFIASIATINYVSRFVLSGEGIAIADIGAAAMNDAIASARPAWSGPLDIEVIPTTMRDWARGAAAVAIMAMVDDYSSER